MSHDEDTRDRRKRGAAAMTDAIQRTALQIHHRLLCRFARSESEQTRVTLDTKPGDHGRTIAWVSVRRWYRGTDGEWRPGKGETLRLRDLGETIAALEHALDLWKVLR